jgi:NhaP-type Na+/H+ or K+/H+ antiporter
MSKIKTIAKAIVLIISGIAIVVVGGFMMGAIARLWTGKESTNPKESETKK